MENSIVKKTVHQSLQSDSSTEAITEHRSKSFQGEQESKSNCQFEVVLAADNHDQGRIGMFELCSI